MRRRKFTKSEREALKKAKVNHKREKRLDPTWFQAKRTDLGAEIVTAVTSRLPRWGSFNFVFTKTGI